jgi:hypothetical protein
VADRAVRRTTDRWQHDFGCKTREVDGRISNHEGKPWLGQDHGMKPGGQSSGVTTPVGSKLGGGGGEHEGVPGGCRPGGGLAPGCSSGCGKLRVT